MKKVLLGALVILGLVWVSRRKPASAAPTPTANLGSPTPTIEGDVLMQSPDGGSTQWIARQSVDSYLVFGWTEVGYQYQPENVGTVLISRYGQALYVTPAEVPQFLAEGWKRGW